MGARARGLFFAFLLLLPSFAWADSCPSPWSFDYRRLPGPWEMGVGGSTIDAGFFRDQNFIVLLGSDDAGPWLRTYRFEAPTTVEMVAERRDLAEPTAVELAGDRVFLLDDGVLREFHLATTGAMQEVGVLVLAGAPRLLAVRDDRAWAAGETVVHQIDVGTPAAPVLLHSVEGSIGGANTLRCYGDRAWLLGFETNSFVLAFFPGGELTLSTVAGSGARFMDVGFTAGGNALFALEVFDGLFGTAGALMACHADDLFLTFGMSWLGCGQDIPYWGSMPVTHQISEDARGFLVSREAGFTMSPRTASWALHGTQLGEPPLLDSGVLRSRPREMAYLGDYLVGRTDDGLFVVAPESTVDSPVLSILDVPSSRNLATDGRIVAAGAATRIQLVDAGDPRNPRLGGVLALDKVDWLEFVEGDDRLYVRREEIVSAWDLTDLDHPQLVQVRGVNPGFAKVGKWEGQTALFVATEDSLRLQVWTGPARPPEMLDQWDLAAPMAFSEVAPPIAGGPEAFVRLDEPEPLVPRRVWEGGLGDPTSGPPLRPVAMHYRPTFTVTQDLVQVHSIHLDRCPVTAADHHFLPRQQETYMTPVADLLGDQIWIASFGWIAVGAADGPEEGSVWALLSPTGLGVDVKFARIAATDRFTAIGGEQSLSLLAPHCAGSSLPVSTLVSSFAVTRTADGCAAIRFVADLDLELYRVRPGPRVLLNSASNGDGYREVVDCPGAAATYELADASGVVYAIREFSPEAPRALTSVVARPNPFNPKTVIEFALSSTGPVQLVVFDTRGRRVRTLVDEDRPAGRHFAEWDGRDGAGSAVSAGVYFVQLRTPGETATAKVGLVK